MSIVALVNITSCVILLRNNNTTQRYIVYLLKVSSKYFPEYWFFIEADGMCKLEDIDSLLRDMWLECCGHLSCFTINNQRYEFGQIPGSVVGV
jgi:hypothetical protein